MKKWIICILLTLLILPSAEAGYGLFGTYWDSKNYEDMDGVGLRLGSQIYSGVGIEARVSYVSTDLFGNPDMEMDMLPLEALALWTIDLTTLLKPYIGGGIGYYMKNPQWKSNDLGGRIEANDCFGYFGIAGFNFLLGNAKLFGEAKYNLISEDDNIDWRGTGVEEKYSLDGLSINVGLVIGF